MNFSNYYVYPNWTRTLEKQLNFNCSQNLETLQMTKPNIDVSQHFWYMNKLTSVFDCLFTEEIGLSSCLVAVSSSLIVVGVILSSLSIKERIS